MLKEQGATALDDAALKALIVGKTFKIRNDVTNQEFEILYGNDGRRLITKIDGKQPEVGEIGAALHSGALGSPAEYEIKELRSALANVAKARPAFRNQAVGETIQAFMNGPFGAIEAAIRDRDGTKFVEAYAGVNSGCNACHSALSQPQVVIKIPDLAAYPEQDFGPPN
jgi:hypothetical protein